MLYYGHATHSPKYNRFLFPWLQKIGDSFRGWVDSEVELDLLLTYHKQQTQSFWGTRQSPSPAKTSTRLMWKSQYVPFDGIPFVNSGELWCVYTNRDQGLYRD